MIISSGTQIIICYLNSDVTHCDNIKRYYYQPLFRDECNYDHIILHIIVYYFVYPSIVWNRSSGFALFLNAPILLVCGYYPVGIHTRDTP